MTKTKIWKWTLLSRVWIGYSVFCWWFYKMVVCVVWCVHRVRVESTHFHWLIQLTPCHYVNIQI